MGDFIPTTEQVRDGYRYDPEAEYHDPITPHHNINGRAFDRWLAEVKADAWDEGYKTCDQVWVETADITTPDEYRTDPANPHRGKK